jgi:hypothetical protein
MDLTILGLFQLRRDRRELGVQLGPKSIYDRDDCERNASGDDAVFDGGCAGFVSQKRVSATPHGDSSDAARVWTSRLNVS